MNRSELERWARKADWAEDRLTERKQLIGNRQFRRLWHEHGPADVGQAIASVRALQEEQASLDDDLAMSNAQRAALDSWEDADESYPDHSELQDSR